MMLKKNCKIIKLKRIPSNKGFLVQAQIIDNVPFKIKRVFYIYNVPRNRIRGGHAHKKQSQFLISLNDRLKIKITDGKKNKVYNLNEPSKGLLIPPGHWVSSIEFFKNSIALVLVDDIYKEKDYIRDFDKYLKFVKANFSKN